MRTIRVGRRTHPAWIFCPVAYNTSTASMNFMLQIVCSEGKLYARPANCMLENHGTVAGTEGVCRPWNGCHGAEQASRGNAGGHLGLQGSHQGSGACPHRQMGGDSAEFGRSGAPPRRGGDGAGRECGCWQMRLLVAAAAGRSLSSPQVLLSLCSFAQREGWRKSGRPL